MKIFETIENLKKEISKLKSENKTIGFIPTMGALHQGHLSLSDFSRNDCDITVFSIFVNPTQFNNKSDLEKYPRTIEKDIEKLKSKGVDIVFTPNENEMYPNEDRRKFNFGKLETLMEGKYREGHFNGVAQIVSKLFYAVNADKAYFGLKDFQQVAVIKAMVKMLEMPIKIIACPIVREKSGLAMSSRNQRLSQEQKQDATILYRTLSNIKNTFSDYSPQDLQKKSIEHIESNSNLKVEYLEIVNDKTLESIERWNESEDITCCVAAFCGEVRLIDNLKII